MLRYTLWPEMAGFTRVPSSLCSPNCGSPSNTGRAGKLSGHGSLRDCGAGVSPPCFPLTPRRRSVRKGDLAAFLDHNSDRKATSLALGARGRAGKVHQGRVGGLAMGVGSRSERGRRPGWPWGAGPVVSLFWNG